MAIDSNGNIFESKSADPSAKRSTIGLELMWASSETPSVITEYGAIWSAMGQMFTIIKEEKEEK